MANKTENRGGARAGAGRPSVDDPKRTFCVTLHESEIELLRHTYGEKAATVCSGIIRTRVNNIKKAARN